MFKIKIFISIILLALLGNKQALAQPNFAWAKSNQGLLSDQATAVAIDGSGNVYYAGDFEGTFDLDPTTGTSTVTSAGLKDNFVIKLDASGNFIWGKTISGSNNSYITDMVIDASSNIILVGNLLGTADFDPSTSNSLLAAPGTSNAGYVLKLDMNGNFVWAKIYSSLTTSIMLVIVFTQPKNQ